MAYYRKRKGGWQAQIERDGVRESKTFALKATADRWAAQREADIAAGVCRFVTR